MTDESRPWWDGPLVGFDLETTSANPEEARIVTAAVAVCSRDGIDARTWLADPGVPIPEEAAKVHGITTERAQAEGRPAAEVVREVAELLAACATAPLVIFNARYDLTVLDREARRHGIGPLPLLFGHVIDPYVIDKWLDRFRKGSRKLDALCEHYRAALDGAHDAASDAIAAARLAWCIGARGQVVRNVWNADMGRERAALRREWESVRGDLVNLHDAQRRWAAEQAMGLAQHFRKQGKTEEADDVRIDWPLIPVGVAA